MGAEPLGGSCVPLACRAIDDPSMRGVEDYVRALSGTVAVGAL